MKLILAVLVLLCLFSSVVSFAASTGTKVAVKKAAPKVKKAEANIIGKQELVAGLSEKSGVSKKGVELVLNAFTNTIREEVTQKGNTVRLFQFGSFKQRVNKARNVRNPKTGAQVAVKESKSLSFSASSAMKEKDE